jgi:hypothetical protein
MSWRIDIGIVLYREVVGRAVCCFQLVSLGSQTLVTFVVMILERASRRRGAQWLLDQTPHSTDL